MPTTDWPEGDDELDEESNELEPENASLQHVDTRERVDVAHYERETEADLAAGMLRSNGIAAEVATMMIPGLNYSLTLWVRRSQEALARQLLHEAEQGDFRD